MNSPLLASFLAHYQWLPTLITIAGIIAVFVITGFLRSLVPAFREADALNAGTYKEKMQQSHYAANMKWNSRWAPLYMFVIFFLIMPFSVTLQAQPWWQVPLDVVVILFVYDFFYYLTHRFLFHDSPFLGGPLKWMHAVHHRQHNPCRKDAGYIHPLEVAIGLGLFIATIFVLSLVMGRFHVVTVVIAWYAFSEINVHNHTLWKADYAPFQYLSYASRMHHNHHARFTGGNYATITLLFDWLFGTLDDGNGYGKHRKQ
jgi:sterol desaturase/sphingolipid hydroxylase (fatty acid hydroxylase superfamily)